MRMHWIGSHLPANLQSYYVDSIAQADIIVIETNSLKKISALCQSHRKPLLVIESSKNPETRAQILQSGADDCVSTPVKDRELIARIDALLRNPQSLVHISLEDITIYTDSHILVIGDTPIKATLREASIMETLIRVYPKSLKRDEIITTIWGNLDNFASFYTHIARIKKKVEHNSKKVFLCSHRVNGYSLQVLNN